MSHPLCTLLRRERTKHGTEQNYVYIALWLNKLNKWCGHNVTTCNPLENDDIITPIKKPSHSAPIFFAFYPIIHERAKCSEAPIQIISRLKSEGKPTKFISGSNEIERIHQKFSNPGGIKLVFIGYHISAERVLGSMVLFLKVFFPASIFPFPCCRKSPICGPGKKRQLSSPAHSKSDCFA